MVFTAEIPEENYEIKIQNSKVKNPRYTEIRVGDSTLAFKNIANGLSSRKQTKLLDIAISFEEAEEEQEEESLEVSKASAERVTGLLFDAFEILSVSIEQANWIMEELPTDIQIELLKNAMGASEDEGAKK